MKKNKSISFNFMMNSILSISTFIFPLITFPYVSRILLPEGVGKVSFATSVIAYFLMFAQLGIPIYGIRSCAEVRYNREKLSQTVHEIFLINLITGLISYLLLIFSICNIDRLRDEKSLFLVTSFTVIFNSLGLNWLYQGLEKYTYITIRSLIFKIISIIAMFLFVKDKNDYVIYSGICVFAAGGENILNFLNLNKYIDFNFNHNYKIKKHIKPILVFFAMSVATTIYTNLDNVMLGFLVSSTEVGYYNTAIKIKVILTQLVTSLGTVILPRASYYYQNQRKSEFNRIICKSFKFVTLVGIPLMAYFILYAKESVLFLSGSSYVQAVLPMRIIMPTVVFIGFSNVMGFQMLIPMGKEKVVLVSEIIGAIANIIMNGIFIPQYGAAGAAVGTLVAEALVSIIQFIVLRRTLNPMLKEIKFFGILLSIGLAVFVSFFFKYMNISNFGILICSSISFFAIYLSLLIMCKEPLIIECIQKLKYLLISKT
ncbi:MAG: flippase [Malacoplasma sp.]